MKIFANKSIWKKILIVFLLLISISFIKPEPVRAGVGGELMEPICDLVVGIGDGLIGVLHKLVLGQDITMITINLGGMGIGILKFIAVIIGFIVIAALLALGTGVIGASFIALGEVIGGTATSFTAAFSLGGAIVKAIGVIIPLAIGGGVYAGAKIYSADGWRDKQLDLPLYSVSPEEIFSNKIPLFDVNFFDPDETKEWKYDFAMHLEITDEIKNADYTLLASGTKAQVDEVLKNYGLSVDAINNLNFTDESGAHYYATDDKVIKIYSSTNWVGGIGDGSGSAYVADLKVEKGEVSIPAYNRVLSKNISKWYYILRTIAIVGMMSVLVYIGIRILISSTSPQKAKYKQLLGDWLVGMVLLFTMHYIMVFANFFTEEITELLDGINPIMYSAIIQSDKDGKLKSQLEKYGYTVTDTHEEVTNGDNQLKADVGKVVYLGPDEKDPENKYLEWDTNLMGMLRIQTREIEQEDDNKYIGFSIMFFVMVLYTLIFSWTYIKRVIYLAFLTMIAPMVALTYPIDKANDGSAQGFNYWFKEYIFNLLLQPMHLLIYTLLVSTAVELAITNWIYALVALGFITAAEKIVRQMFNFSKASTPGILAGPAGAALTMTGIRWLFGHGPRGAARSSGKADSGKSSSVSDGEFATGENKLSMIDRIRDNQNPPNPANQPNPPDSGKIINAIDSGNSPDGGANPLGGSGANPPGGSGANPPGGSGANPSGGSGADPSVDDGTTDFADGGADFDYYDDDDYDGGDNSNGDADNNGDGNGDDENKTSHLRAIGSALSLYRKGIGNKLSRSFKEGQPIRTLGNLGAGAIAGTTFGMLGAAAGIASGDASKAFQYGGAAFAGGAKLGSGVYNSAAGALQVDGLDEEYSRSLLGEDEYQRKQALRKQNEWKRSEDNINEYRKLTKGSRADAEAFLNSDFAKKCLDNNISDVKDVYYLQEALNKDRTHLESRPTGNKIPVIGQQKVQFRDKDGRLVTRTEKYETGEFEDEYKDVTVYDGKWKEEDLITAYKMNKAYFGGSTNTNKDTMDKMEATWATKEYSSYPDSEKLAKQVRYRVEGLQRTLNEVQKNV